MMNNPFSYRYFNKTIFAIRKLFSTILNVIPSFGRRHPSPHVFGVPRTSRSASATKPLGYMAFLFTILLTGGCVTRYQTYHQLKHDTNDIQYSEYYRSAVKPDGSNTTAVTNEDVDFKSQIDEKIMRLKRNWEKTLSEIPVLSRDLVNSNEFSLNSTAQNQSDIDLIQADQHLSSNLDWDFLLRLSKARNPSIKAARENVKATLEQYPQTVYLDDILQQYNAFTKQLNTQISTQKQKKMQSMSFPFPDTLALKGQVVNEDVEIARLQEEIVVRDVVTEVKTAWFEWIYLDEAIRIDRENQELLEQILKVAQSKIRVDRTNYNSVIMTQVELSKLTDDIITLEDKRQTVIARINTLLNRPPQAALGTPLPAGDFEPVIPIIDIYERAIEERQELNLQRRLISRMKLMVELVKRMTYPDATTGSSYFEDRMRLSSGTDDQSSPPFATQNTGKMISTPWYGQQDAYIREIELKINSISDKLTAFEDDVRFRIRQEHFGLETAKRSISLYRDTLLPQAYQAVGAANTGYQSGKSDFLTFLDSQRTLLKFQIEEQKALRNHRQHLARLDQLVGRSLAKQKLELRVSKDEKGE